MKMLDDLKEKISGFIHSRFLLPYLAVFFLTLVLVNRIFQLQIVKGEDYMDNFTLSIEKQVSIPSTRGNIYDRNGVLLACNELAYSVTITDTLESGNGKNENLNNIILTMIRLIEENGDHVDNDFNIYLDEDDNYCFAVSGTALSRFLADVYGRAAITDMSYSERNSNPDELIAFLCSEDKFGIGTYVHDGGRSYSRFIPQMGYTKEEILSIINIRYRLSQNAFQKYIATVVASDVSDKTVAVISENSDILQGVSIEESTVRRYNNSVYFSPIIGYTGKISSQEYETYSELDPNYTTNDVVGKTGIEYSMESYLQGTKGSETIFVDNLGKVIEVKDVIEPLAGNDIYLSIDANLQIAAYNLLEQKIAGILMNKIVNARTVNTSTRNQSIAIYDVYFALIDNNVINLNHLSKPYAGENEQAVYNAYLERQAQVLEKLEDTLLYDDTPYNRLSDEMKEYESYIVSMLSASNYGVLLSGEIDTTDTTYIAWRTDETISIREYLNYCISKQWVDTTKLNLSDRYSDSDEIYRAMVEYIIEKLENNTAFAKKIYKYMLQADQIQPKQLCMILWEQDAVQIDSDRVEALESGRISSYAFITDLISRIKLTPAQLGLTPCSGSVVIVDPNNGEVLACVSYPGYDNNRLGNTVDSAYLAKLSSDNSNPLWNYATQQRTAPGSTFKMVSSVAGVESGVITVNTPITCTGSFTKLNSITHRCWVYPGSHGALTLSGAIENSCNYFFYEVGYRLADDGNGYNDAAGIEKISYYASQFGLGERSGVEISESEPHISDQYPVPSAIGQGTHNYTTVGLARYVTAVANSGTVYNLSLVHEIKDSQQNSIYYYTPDILNRMELSDSLWNAIHTGMRNVVANKKYFAAINLHAAGKTGTAQEAANRPNHALFVGYAPYENPDISIAVRIANGYSSDYAAQVACDVFKYYFNLEDAEDIITGTASEATTVSAGD